MARPTACTPDVTALIEEAVLDGCPFDDAAILGGIQPSTFYDWMARGRNGDEPFAEFSERIARARSKAKQDALKAIHAGMLPGKDALPDWKARAWFLERCHPEQFAPKAAVSVKVEKELEDALDKLKVGLSDEEYQRVLGALAGAAGGETPGGSQG